jgi:hypothetical protein
MVDFLVAHCSSLFTDHGVAESENISPCLESSRHANADPIRKPITMITAVF